jgi:hypothetical protein
MKVRRVVTDTGFHEHSDDDAEEAADLWHGDLILRPCRGGPLVVMRGASPGHAEPRAG